MSAVNDNDQKVLHNKEMQDNDTIKESLGTEQALKDASTTQVELAVQAQLDCKDITTLEIEQSEQSMTSIEEEIPVKQIVNSDQEQSTSLFTEQAHEIDKDDYTDHEVTINSINSEDCIKDKNVDIVSINENLIHNLIDPKDSDFCKQTNSSTSNLACIKLEKSSIIDNNGEFVQDLIDLIDFSDCSYTQYSNAVIKQDSENLIVSQTVDVSNEYPQVKLIDQIPNEDHLVEISEKIVEHNKNSVTYIFDMECIIDSSLNSIQKSALVEQTSLDNEKLLLIDKHDNVIVPCQNQIEEVHETVKDHVHKLVDNNNFTKTEVVTDVAEDLVNVENKNMIQSVYDFLQSEKIFSSVDFQNSTQNEVIHNSFDKPLLTDKINTIHNEKIGMEVTCDIDKTFVGNLQESVEENKNDKSLLIKSLLTKSLANDELNDLKNQEFSQVEENFSIFISKSPDTEHHIKEFIETPQNVLDNNKESLCIIKLLQIDNTFVDAENLVSNETFVKDIESYSTIESSENVESYSDLKEGTFVTNFSISISKSSDTEPHIKESVETPQNVLDNKESSCIVKLLQIDYTFVNAENLVSNETCVKDIESYSTIESSENVESDSDIKEGTFVTNESFPQVEKSLSDKNILTFACHSHNNNLNENLRIENNVIENGTKSLSIKKLNENNSANTTKIEIAPDMSNKLVTENALNPKDEIKLTKNNSHINDREFKKKDSLLSTNSDGSAVAKALVIENISEPLIVDQSNSIDSKESIKSIKLPKTLKKSSEDDVKIVTNEIKILQNNKNNTSSNTKEITEFKGKKNRVTTNSVATLNKVSEDSEKTNEVINRMQSMNWLKNPATYIASMNQNQASKQQLKNLSNKDEQKESYFEGAKRNPNKRHQSSGPAQSKNQSIVSQVKSANTGNQRNAKEQKDAKQAATAVSTNVWNNNTVKALFPNVQSVVIDREKEANELHMAMAESICTAQQESEKRKMCQANSKTQIQDEFNDGCWGQIQPNLPDVQPTNTDSSNSIVDQYGRINGCTEKHMHMGKGARRKEREFIRTHTENKTQTRSNLSFIPNRPFAKKPIQELDSQTSQEVNKVPNLSKNNQHQLSSNCQKVEQQTSNITQPSNKIQEMSLHGRFGKNITCVQVDSSMKKNQHNSGSSQGLPKGGNQGQKNITANQSQEKLVPKNQNHNMPQNQVCANKGFENTNKSQETSNKVENILDKKQECMIKSQDDFSKQQDHSVKVQDSTNKKQECLNRILDNAIKNQELLQKNQKYFSKGQDHMNYQSCNRNQDNIKNQSYSSKSQDSIVKNQDQYNKNQNQPEQTCDNANQNYYINRYQNCSNRIQDNASQNNSISNRNFSDRSQDNYRNQNYCNKSQNTASKIQEQFNRSQNNFRNQNYADKSQDTIIKNQEQFDRNQYHRDKSHETTSRNQYHCNRNQNFTNRNQDNVRTQGFAGSIKNRNEENWDEEGNKTSYIQRDPRNQLQECKNSSDQYENSKFEEVRKINIDKRVNSSISAKIENEKPNTRSPLLKNPPDLCPGNSFHHSTSDSTTKASNSMDLHESNHTLLKTGTGVKIENLKENLNIEPKTNVSMFKGNENLQRALGLNPNLGNPLQTANQQIKLNDVPISGTVNPVNIPQYFNSDVAHNLPLSQSVQCANFSTPMVYANSMMNVNASQFDASNFIINQERNSDMVSAIPNPIFEVPLMQGADAGSQPLHMNEISNASQEMYRLYHTVNTLSKQLAAAQASLLAAQAKMYHDNLPYTSNEQNQSSQPNMTSITNDVQNQQSQSLSLPPELLSRKYSNISSISNDIQTVQNQSSSLAPESLSMKYSNISSINNDIQLLQSQSTVLPPELLPMKYSNIPSINSDVKTLQSQSSALTHDLLSRNYSVPPGFSSTTISNIQKVPQTDIYVQDYQHDKFHTNPVIEQMLNIQPMYVQGKFYPQQTANFQQYGTHVSAANMMQRGRTMPKTNERRKLRSGAGQPYNQ